MTLFIIGSALLALIFSVAYEYAEDMRYEEKWRSESKKFCDDLKKHNIKNYRYEDSHSRR